MQSEKQEIFKREILPLLSKYEVIYRNYQNGDLGDLEQIIVESKNKGGGIDFWSSGWLGIELYDYKNEKEMISVLLETEEEYLSVLEKFKKLL